MALIDEIINKAKELKKAGMTVDSISASNGDESVEIVFAHEENKTPKYTNEAMTGPQEEPTEDDLDFFHES